MCLLIIHTALFRTNSSSGLLVPCACAALMPPFCLCAGLWLKTTGSCSPFTTGSWPMKPLTSLSTRRGNNDRFRTKPNQIAELGARGNFCDNPGVTKLSPDTFPLNLGSKLHFESELQKRFLYFRVPYVVALWIVQECGCVNLMPLYLYPKLIT